MIAPWEELYRLTEQWKKDLSFYEDELHFFENLLHIYGNQPDNTITLLKDLVNDSLIQLQSLMIQADQHLAHLGKIIKENDNSEDLLFREEHDILEDNINAFVQALFHLKQKLFAAIEQKMHEPARK